MNAFENLIVSLRRAASVARIFTNKVERDVHYFICVAPAVSISGVVGLLVNFHANNHVLAVEIASGSVLCTVPLALWIATHTWKNRLYRVFPVLSVDRYINFHELSYQDYRRNLQAIDEARLSAADAVEERRVALHEYLDRTRKLRDALFTGTHARPAELPP